MPTTSCRKLRQYKGLHPPSRKTDRTGLCPKERAFTAGAAILGGVFHGRISKYIDLPRRMILYLIKAYNTESRRS